MKFKTIKKKLIATFLLIILAPMCASAAISNITLFRTLKNSYMSSIEKAVTGVNSTIDESYNSYESTLSQLTENTIAKTALDKQTPDSIRKELGGVIKSNPRVLNAYIATEAKGMFIYPEVKLPDGYDPTVKSWYKSTLEAKSKIIWQDAYKDVATGKTVVTATKTIFDDSGKAIGVAGIDIDITNIAELFKNTKIEDTGEILLVDKSGMVLATKNKDLVDKNINPERVNTNADTKDQKVENAFKDPKEMDWVKPVIAGKSDSTQTKFLGKDKFIYYMSNEKSGWKLIGTLDTSEVNIKIINTLAILVGVFLIFIAASLIVAFKVSKSLTTPIGHLKEAMEKGEAGDLTVITHIHSKDELGELGKRFTNMVSSVKELVVSVKASASQVLDYSESLAKRADEVSISSSEISRVIDEISQGAQEQASETDNASSVTIQFNESLAEMNEFNNTINSESRIMEQNNEKALQAVKNLKDKNSSTIEGVSQISSNIETLVSETEDIGNILNTILNISEQTNLLALNAAIEAARAGESGRGFAVVAEEVRKLAEQSSLSAEDIRNIINRVIDTTKVAASSMDEIKQDIEIQNKAVALTEESFNKLDVSIKSIMQTIGSMSKNIESMFTKSSTLTSNIHNISAVSQQSAAASEEVNASVSNQLNDIENVKHQAKELYDLAKHLDVLIEKFKV